MAAKFPAGRPGRAASLSRFAHIHSVGVDLAPDRAKRIELRLGQL